MRDRKPNTVYFRHFDELGIYMVFDAEDARACRRVAKRMVFKSDNFDDAKRQFKLAGYEVAIAGTDMVRKAGIHASKPVQRQPKTPVPADFF